MHPLPPSSTPLVQFINLANMNELDPETAGHPPRFEPAPPTVLATLGGLIFLCILLGSGLVALMCGAQGIDLHAAFTSFGAESSTEQRNFMRGALLLNHMSTFLVPAMLCGYVFYKKAWPKALSLENPPSLTSTGLGFLFVMSAFPLAQVAFKASRWVVAQFPFLEKFVAVESETEGLLEGMLLMQSPLELVFSLLVMGIVPALGEEMVFRGHIQPQLGRWAKRPLLGIVLTALVFSIVHFEVQRLLAIFWLGLMLGLLFYWTKNLWVPIAAHFLNNGAQVVVAYFNQDKLKELNAGAGEDLPLVAVLVSAVILAGTGFLLWKNAQSEALPAAEQPPGDPPGF